jgi:hypothetical protein
MAAPEKLFEVNKDMELTSMMQLVDLNGTMVNFQSDFTITTSDEILVAIVNQHQLDNGELHFEQAGKSYSRRVTYQENEHQNHYLAIKSLPSQTAKCHVTIRLRELPPLAKRKTQDRDVMNSRLDDREDRRVRFQDDMPREPRDMSRDPRDMSRDPRDMPRETRDMSREPRDMPREPRETRNTPRSFPSELEPSVKKELSDQLEELYQQEDYVDNVEHDDNAKKPQLKHQNPYYLVGIICVALFVLMLSYKFLRKK